jgi:hypothetical protein
MSVAVLHQGQARLRFQDLPGFWYQRNEASTASMPAAHAHRRAKDGPAARTAGGKDGLRPGYRRGAAQDR